MSHFRHPGERTAPPAVDAAERRRFLAALSLAPAAGAVSTLAASSAAQAQTPVNSQAHIVIVGGGAAGLTAANRLAAGLKGAKITLIDARKEHFYQPGFTLVAAGIKPGNYVVTATADYLPQGVEWVQASAAEIDPEARKVVTTDGKTIAYDFLVVTTGLKLDYAAIPGMDTGRIGQNGLGSIYHSPQAASATWGALSAFADKGWCGRVQPPRNRNEMRRGTAEVRLHQRRPFAPPGHTQQIRSHLQRTQQGVFQRAHRVGKGAHAV